MGLLGLWPATDVVRAQATDRADTLRGSIGPERAWWDVRHYDVTVRPDFTGRTIEGTVILGFRALDDGGRMQIDLQQPLEVRSIKHELEELAFEREGNVVRVDLSGRIMTGHRSELIIHYAGKPREAKQPPWDGGWIWKTDAQGDPWMSVACQGLGASVWYPCKDHQSDEPDEGATLHIITADSLVGVGNGRSMGSTRDDGGQLTWHWRVSAPINTYNLVPYIGKYVHFGERIAAVDGPLDLDFWVLRESEEAAVAQFAQVPAMIQCFEQWLGPYPFYSDGYKLVEAPHLGMEHQSAIAYGNGFRNGYLGRDISGTGHGLKWDFIIVHESGHEWFGNSMTTADIADMWVHEGLTQYTEVLMTECVSGKEAAEEYVIGLRQGIRNERPVIGPYGVNKEGSGDMYPKGANLVHMVRQIMGDSVFKAMLLEMNRRYRHGIVTSAEVERFMDGFTSVDLHGLFDQYLRTTQVPKVEWFVRKRRLWVRWADCVEGFSIPVKGYADDTEMMLSFGTTWAMLPQKVSRRAALRIDANWYVHSAMVRPVAPPLPAGAIRLGP